ncbi:uncharacterized protein PITG_03183 [Phytophthora infestans T30-4]|uniref:Uncharacterized protein n=1 Tax=Phytophthora infestans (strain T30-4) TaxID=403677 RepID=D0MZK7_PHYIT|nr:uncharacterized protein PITG_03183 [Phytophthora infestans T30-4]EEY65670.1 hypothetical protein PITG_03183 [Phytophthora infestans T30-4]|eukprot:XP_002906269.1 hypothetical protein PITG_03183 [Phytophthora infestans T30-4]
MQRLKPRSEGVVSNLLQQNLSEREIKPIIPVGGSQIARLRKTIKSGVEVLHTPHCLTWILEDGFPCPHRRPRQYFTEPKVTWKLLHERYCDEVTRADPDIRTMSYERSYSVRSFFYPGERLTRTKEDVCDCCVQTYPS